MIDLTLDSTDGQGLAWLYEHAAVLRRSHGEASGAVSLTVRVPAERADQVKARFGWADRTLLFERRPRQIKSLIHASGFKFLDAV